MSEPKDGWRKLDTNKRSDHAEKFREQLNAIKGNPDVKDSLADAFENYEAGFKESDKPICAMFSTGGSGTGKTFTPKTLALILLGSEDALTRIDCTELSEPHTVSTLKGSPPGYKDCDKEPRLSQENIDRPARTASGRLSKRKETLEENRKILTTVEAEILKGYEYKLFLSDETKKANGLDDTILDRKLRNNMIYRRQMLNFLEEYEKMVPEETEEKPPISIIVFDEIEKADKAVWNLIINIIDNGILTCANGSVTSFRNSYIFCTSNEGSKEMAETMGPGTSIGFQSKSIKKKGKNFYDVAIDALEKKFPKEFLARFTRINVYPPLSYEVLMEIFYAELKKFEELHTKPLLINLDLEKAVIDYIVVEATDRPQNGARLLKNKIYKCLKRQLARLKNRGELHIGDIIHILLNSSDPKKPRLEFYCEPMDDITPLLIEAGLSPDGEIKPTLNDDGTLRKPDGENDNPSDDYDGVPPGPLIKK